MGDTDNMDDTPLPPPPADQPARTRDDATRPFGDALVRNQFRRPDYYNACGVFNAAAAPQLPGEMFLNRESGHEISDLRLDEDFSDESALNGYQSAEDFNKLYPAPADISREILNKLDGLLEVLQNLQARVSQMENNRKQSATRERSLHLRPEQNALPRHMNSHELASRALALPVTSLEKCIDQRSSPHECVQRTGREGQTSHRLGSSHYLAFPRGDQHDSERWETGLCIQMQRVASSNTFHERARSGGN